MNDKMNEEKIAQILALGATWAKKRGRDLAQEIMVLPLHIELAIYCSSDPESRRLIEELGQWENLTELSPPSLKPFVLDLRDNILHRVCDRLVEIGEADYEKIMSILEKRNITN